MIVQLLLYICSAWASFFGSFSSNKIDVCVLLLNETNFHNIENLRQCRMRVEHDDILDRLKDVCVFRNASRTPFMSRWQSFKSKFQKRYPNSTEELLRCLTFQNSLRRIERLNARHKAGFQSFYLKVTEYADLTDEEFRKAYLGPGGPGTAWPTKNLPSFPAAPPDNLDWRRRGFKTSVKNQRRCGSCWAFGAIGSLEAQYFLRHGALKDFSEQQVVDCTYAGRSGCLGGSPIVAFNYIRTFGITSEESYPYVAKGGKCRLGDAKIVTKIVGFHILTPGDEDLMKRAVASNGPLAVAFYMPPSMRLYGGGVFNRPTECPRQHFNHVVLIVGYGTTKEKEDYWLVKNSFGVDWGNEGYFKIPRGSLFCSMGLFSTFPVLP